MDILYGSGLTRWAVVVGLAACLLALGRLFLLVCPTREWTVIRWSLEARTAQSWNRPEIPALVAENAVENGGRVGEWVGRTLYQTAVVPIQQTPLPQNPQPYADVHLPAAWLGTESITWSTKPFSEGSVLVQVFVQARLLQRPTYGRGCSTAQPVTSLVERDYVTVPTPRGWRVAYVYVPYAGAPLERPAALGPGTAAAALAGC